MSDDITVYTTDQLKLHGNVVIAGNEEVACAMHDDGVDVFAINHQYKIPGRIQVFYNEKAPDGTIYQRQWDVDPVKFNHALTRLVREAKTKNQESFI